MATKGGGSTLDANDITQLCNSLSKAGFTESNWFELGMKLNISFADLKNIEADYPGAHRRLGECIALWLKQTPAANRTYDTICTALKDMKEIAVAESIEEFNYKCVRLSQRIGPPRDQLAPFSNSKIDKILRTEAQHRVTTGNIAAIDFGTTSVSLACIIGEDEKVGIFVLDTEAQDTRVPNAVLLKRERNEVRVEAFGGVARTRFITMKAVDHSNYIYFERIKMLLKRDKNKIIDRQSLVDSFSGEKYYLVEVIAFILKYIKELLVDRLSRSVKPLKTTDFDWVITVPAIWDARGKRMMREAAYMAGLLTGSAGITQFTQVSSRSLPLPNETNADKLSLALKPEVAALYSQEIVSKDIQGAGDKAAIPRPTNYMVIDIGGTVDITAHAERDGGIVVESIPTGNTLGGNLVNEAFSKLLQKIVGDPEFKRFLPSSLSKEKYASNMAALNKIFYAEFEKQKLSFGHCHNETITIDLPSKFTKFYEDVLEDGATNIRGIEYDEVGDTLYISKPVIESQLFGPAIDGIISCTLDAIKQNEFKSDTFYLVGGFGGCKYVHQKVYAAIERLYQSKRRKCHVLVPTSPDLAVVQGAVLWRKNLEKLKPRQANATYGIDACVPFDFDKHDECYGYYDEEDKKFKCKNIFKVLIHKGDCMNNIISLCVTPTEQSQERLRINIYATSSEGVEYTVDKKGCKLVTSIGQLVIDIPNRERLPKNQRKVIVMMDFEGIEIHAKAKYLITGQELNTVWYFLSES